MTTSLTNSVKNRSRLEQHAVLKELRVSSPHIRKLNLLQNILKPVVYFLILYFLGIPLLDRMGAFWFISMFVVMTILFEELVWRLLLLPAMDKELKRQTEPNQ